MFELLLDIYTMEEQWVRLILALLFLSIGSYYDIFNRKNVPEKMLYGTLIVSFFVSFFLSSIELFLYGVVQAVLLGLVGFALYRLGQIGGADVFFFSTLSLLLPIWPGIGFNYPFILIILLFSSMIFALYLFLYYSKKIIQKNARGNFFALLLFAPYIPFLYLLSSSVLPTLYIIFLAFFYVFTVFFLTYRDFIHEDMIKKISLKDAEPEEVIATEKMKIKVKRVLDEKEIKRLRKLGIKKLPIYDLPPFLPFLLLGLVCSVLFYDVLFV